jgi:hypothetical protein
MLKEGIVTSRPQAHVTEAPAKVAGTGNIAPHSHFTWYTAVFPDNLGESLTGCIHCVN